MRRGPPGHALVMRRSGVRFSSQAPDHRCLLPLTVRAVPSLPAGDRGSRGASRRVMSNDGGSGSDHLQPSGTRGSSPWFAGTVTIADHVTGPLGQSNPALFALPSTTPSALFDMVPTAPPDQ